MDAFKAFFEAVIPFAIVLVLVALAAVFFYLIKILIETRQSVIKINLTLDDVNHKLAELEAPMQTVTKLSSSVNALHDAGGKAVLKAVGSTSKGVGALRSILGAVSKKKRKQGK